MFWSPYVVVVLLESFFSWYKPPSAVEFLFMWLANANSAVNVFIYSTTNTQFRRQFVLLASRLCCSCPSSSERPNLGRPGGPNLSTSLPAINLSMINTQTPDAPGANTPDVVVTLSADYGNGAVAQLLTVPRTQFLTVDNMKHVVSIETLSSIEEDGFLY